MLNRDMAKSETELVARRLLAIGVERTFAVDGYGWTVREIIDRESQTKALIFSSETIVRRVTQYPANWRDLTARDLQTVSWGL